MRVGYARVSTTDQDLGLQLQQLAGCERVFNEQMSGSFEARPQLQSCLEFVRAGDTLVVTRLDRLARSVLHLCTIAQDLERKGVALVVMQQDIDTHTATGRLLFNMLGAIAQFERELLRERQRDGIERAKAAGRYKGGTPKLDAADREEIRALRAQGATVPKLARRYRVSQASIYRALGKPAA